MDTADLMENLEQVEAALNQLAEIAETLAEALKEARAYVLRAVNDDGGIDNCEVGDRITLERIDAALSKAGVS